MILAMASDWRLVEENQRAARAAIVHGISSSTPSSPTTTGCLREGAKSYVKCLHVGRGPAPGHRYSPVRLMCSHPSGETWVRNSSYRTGQLVRYAGSGTDAGANEIVSKGSGALFAVALRLINPSRANRRPCARWLGRSGGRAALRRATASMRAVNHGKIESLKKVVAIAGAGASIELLPVKRDASSHLMRYADDVLRGVMTIF